MRSYSILTLAFIFGTYLICAQETQRREIPAFQKIEIAGSLTVYYTHSDSMSLSVKAKSTDQDKVETKVINGVLYVSNKGFFASPIVVYLKANTLKQLNASGAIVFRSTNTLKGDTVQLSISGAANINFSVNAMTIRSVQSGASILTLAGTTQNLQAELSGASSLRAYDLISKNTDIVATGASSSRIYVSEKLRANASGASSIRIKGDVTDISAEAASGSNITKVAEIEKREGHDSTVYHWRNRKIIIIGKENKTRHDDSTHHSSYDADDFKHWAGISFGVNGYMSSFGNTNLPVASQYMDLNYGRSFNIQDNIIERQFNIIRNNFKIITGIGIDYHSYNLSNKTTLNADSSYTGGKIDSSGSYRSIKNVLRMGYLQVPLLFEFNTSNNPCKTFHIAFGVIGEYLVGSRTKQVIEQDRVKIKKIRKDGYNMNPFIAKAHINMGYRGWTFYAEYNLTPLFQAGKGPELYPFTIGLRVIPFT